jgi:hypothetical protein
VLQDDGGGVGHVEGRGAVAELRDHEELVARRQLRRNGPKGRWGGGGGEGGGALTLKAGEFMCSCARKAGGQSPTNQDANCCDSWCRSPLPVAC